MDIKLVKIGTIEDLGDSYKVHKHTEDEVMLLILNKVENTLRLYTESSDLLKRLNDERNCSLVLKDGKNFNVYSGNVSNIHRKLAMFTTDKTFKRNLEANGILQLQQKTAIEMLTLENQSNMVLVPVRYIQDGEEGYWEYKIHYAGERLEFNRKVNGVRVPDHYFSRHEVSIYGDFSLKDIPTSAVRYLEFIEEVTKVPPALQDYYDKAYRGIHYAVKYVLSDDELERKNLSFGTSMVIKISEVRGLVQGKVRSCLLFNRPYMRRDVNDILEDMVKFKTLLTQPKNQVPNPVLDMEIFNNALVKSTLLNILNRSSLIIPTKRFYVQLKHLGLIKDYYRLNSIENVIHVWKLFNSLEPQVTAREALLTIRYSMDNLQAASTVATMASTLRCHRVVEGSVVTMEIIGPSKIIKHYRDLAEVNNIEII